METIRFLSPFLFFIQSQPFLQHFKSFGNVWTCLEVSSMKNRNLWMVGGGGNYDRTETNFVMEKSGQSFF